MENIEKILVKNFSRGQVSYFLDDRRIRRYWAKSGQQILIPVEELKEALYRPGIEKLFTKGFLGIEKKEDRIAVGLDIEEAGVEVKPFTEADAMKILTVSMPQNMLVTALKELTAAGRDALVSVALKATNIDLNKAKTIKDTIGLDILAMIENNRPENLI